jgi:hypothetical protein
MSASGALPGPEADPSLCVEGEYALPVDFHVDNRPFAFAGRYEGRVEASDGRLLVVGELALGVGVVNDSAKAQAAAHRCPLQHLEIAVGIAEGEDGAAVMNRSDSLPASCPITP